MVSSIRRLQLWTFKPFVYSLVSLVTVCVLPALIHQQLVTGTLVNATLLITSVLVGPVESIVVGLIPSLVALSTGTLPLPLAPAIPYIMVGNALYIYSFYRLRQRHAGGAVVAAALIKFGFLYFSSHILLSHLLQTAVLNKVIVMMSWPQLVTAILGGGLALLIIGKRK